MSMHEAEYILAASEAELANPTNVSDNLGETLKGSNISSQANVNLL